MTGVDEDILKKLQYLPIGVANLSTPSGTTMTNIYMVRLVIPSRNDPDFPQHIPRIVIDNVRVIAVKLSKHPYKSVVRKRYIE